MKAMRYLAVAVVAVAISACSDSADSTGPYTVEVTAIPASTQPPRGPSGTHTLLGDVADDGEGRIRTLTDDELTQAEQSIDALIEKADEPLSLCTGTEAMSVEIRNAENALLYDKVVDPCSEGTEWSTANSLYDLLG